MTPTTYAILLVAATGITLLGVFVFLAAPQAGDRAARRAYRRSHQ